VANVDHRTGIWSLKIARKRHKTDYFLTAAMGHYFNPPPKMTADLGCGLGMYCKILTAYGWNCVGYEGTRGIHEIAVFDRIHEVDLSKRLSLPKGGIYDFVLCLEVGEHIPAEREEIFIENLCGFACKDIVLSWAVPGQYSASGHFNCRSNDYVISELAKRGFVFDNDMTMKLREASYFSWFKNTIMCFRGEVDRG